MENSLRSLSPYFKPLAFGATFDILFNISGLTFPGMSFEVSKSLCNTGVTQENVTMGVGNESVLIIGASHYSCYGSHVAIGKPMLTREEHDDFVLFEIFWIEDGRSGEGIGDCIVRAFDIGDLNSVISELDTPSCMTVGQVLRFFEELETNVISVYRNHMWIGEKEWSPFTKGMHDSQHFSIVCQVFAFWR